MIRICCVCKKNMGEKPPYNNKQITHGYCPECLDIAIASINAINIPANDGTAPAAPIDHRDKSP